MRDVLATGFSSTDDTILFGLRVDNLKDNVLDTVARRSPIPPADRLPDHQGAAPTHKKLEQLLHVRACRSRHLTPQRAIRREHQPGE